MSSIRSLLTIASAELATQGIGPDIPAPLVGLLGERNGFLAFESALLVLPCARNNAVPSLADWNRSAGWRSAYRAVGQDVTFFAMDAFCSHFGLSEGGVVRLDPEIGEVTEHSKSIEEWCAKILDNYNEETGWSVAHEWQLENGALRTGDRLLPRKPFVLGGAYEVENLVAVHCERAATMCAELHAQICDLPEGSPVVVRDWFCL